MANQPVDIQTEESVPTKQLVENILENIEIIPYWTQPKYIPHAGKALMISAGHSFTGRDTREVMADIFQHPHSRSHTKIFTVKHCLPYFEKTDEKPDYCVALDPRPINELSTLGALRKDLYRVYPETTYLIASMTHPSVTKYLLDAGARVVGWHSWCAATDAPEIKELNIPSWVIGGSCSAMRGIAMARIMGFRDISLLGYDCTFTAAEAVYHLTQNNSEELKAALDLLQAHNIPVNFPELTETMEAKRLSARKPQEIGVVNYLKELGYKIEPPRNRNIVLPMVVGDHKCWVSGEMAALVKDLEIMFRQNDDVVFHNLSGGFCKAVFDAIDKISPINPHDFFFNPSKKD